MRRETGDLSFHVTYLVRAAAGDVAARAEALLLEQTVELPRDIAARDPSWPSTSSAKWSRSAPRARTHRVIIAHPLATTAGDPAQLLNLLFGNCSLQSDVFLADVDLPDEAFDWLPGPRAGSRGCGPSPGSAAVRCSPRPSSRWASSPLISRALPALRAGRDRPGQGRPRSRRPPVLPVRAPGRGVPRGGRGCSGDTGRSHALRAQPDRDARAGRRQLEFARRVGVKAVMVSPMLLGLAAAARARVRIRRAPDTGTPGSRRPAARGGARAAGHAVPLVRRGRGHLSSCGRSLQLQPRRPVVRSPTRSARRTRAWPRLACSGRGNTGRARGRAARVLRQGLHPADRQQSLRGG